MLLADEPLRSAELDEVAAGRRWLGVWGADPAPGEGEPARVVREATAAPRGRQDVLLGRRRRARRPRRGPRRRGPARRLRRPRRRRRDRPRVVRGAGHARVREPPRALPRRPRARAARRPRRAAARAVVLARRHPDGRDLGRHRRRRPRRRARRARAARLRRRRPRRARRRADRRARADHRPVAGRGRRRADAHPEAAMRALSVRLREEVRAPRRRSSTRRCGRRARGRWRAAAPSTARAATCASSCFSTGSTRCSCAPDARRSTGDASRREHFEALYAANPDPWGYGSSPYERAKYDRTLAALPGGGSGGPSSWAAPSASSASCSPPVARTCWRSTSSRGGRLAKRRTPAGSPTCGRAPRRCRTRPPGRFDLIVCSEILYYWDRPDVEAFCASALRALGDRGCLIAVDWRGRAPTPLDGPSSTECWRTPRPERHTRSELTVLPLDRWEAPR